MGVGRGVGALQALETERARLQEELQKKLHQRREIMQMKNQKKLHQRNEAGQIRN